MKRCRKVTRRGSAKGVGIFMHVVIGEIRGAEGMENGHKFCKESSRYLDTDLDGAALEVTQEG